MLLGWSFVSDQFFPTASPPAAKVENGKAKPLPQPQADPAADTPQAMRGRATVLARNPAGDGRHAEPQGLDQSEGRAVRRSGPRPRSARPSTKNSPPVRLLSPAGAPGAYFAGFGWTGEGVAAPDANTRVDRQRADRSRPGKPVTLTWSNTTGQTLRADRRRR